MCLGGLDVFVFSGRYASVAGPIAKELTDVFAVPGRRLHEPPAWMILPDPLERILADFGAAAVVA